jgi:glycosyltransferase involved in cell wall biosynthesis
VRKEKAPERLNLHIYPSTIEYASRILKETKSLAESGLFTTIIIIGIWKEGLEEWEQIDRNRRIWRVVLFGRRLPDKGFFKAIKLLEWMVRIACKFFREPVLCVNCHSLSVLILGVFFKRLRHVKVIYDTHELETETQLTTGIRRPLAKLLERGLIRQVHATIVVNDSIAEWYQRKYRLANVYTVKNIPDTRMMDLSAPYDLRERFAVPADGTLYIYNGILAEGRGIEILIKVFSQLGTTSHIVFMGYGPFEEWIKDCCQRYGNIHFHTAVKPNEIIAYSRTADIGVSLIEDVSLSYRYCLPNKVFEYILGGLPILVSDLPEMGRLVERYECGWKVAADEKALMTTITGISTEQIKQKRENVLQCQKDFSWSHEEKKLLSIYIGESGGCQVPAPQLLAPGTKVPPTDELSDATSLS